jgi:hypothetical protein
VPIFGCKASRARPTSLAVAAFASRQNATATRSAVRDGHPGDTVGIVVGSSSRAMHRMVGSVAGSLGPWSRVPVVIGP